MAADPGRLIGKPAPRVDGVAKVTGEARYPSDEPVQNPAFAWLVTSAIGRGRIRSMDLATARAVPGVLEILTHRNVGQEVKSPLGPDGGPTTTTLESDRIWHDGQIVAVVVADTFEAAREAGFKVVVHYEVEAPSAGFDSSPRATRTRRPAMRPARSWRRR
jgi:xanthine dehydrogenase YagR molybdenum-binding subunit